MENTLGYVEELDDALRHASEITEKSNNWYMRQANPRFIDDYIQGRLKIVLRGIVGEEGDQGLSVSADSRCSGESDVLRPKIRSAEGDLRCHTHHIQEPPMFSLDVEMVEGNKRRVASLVRSQAFKDVSLGLRKSVYKFIPLVSFKGEKSGLAVCDREIGFVRPSYAISIGKRSGENIEAAADSIDVSASLNGEAERQRRIFARQYELVRSWRFLVSNKNIHVIIEPDSSPALERLEVGFGPTDRF